MANETVLLDSAGVASLFEGSGVPRPPLSALQVGDSVIIKAAGYIYRFYIGEVTVIDDKGRIYTGNPEFIRKTPVNTRWRHGFHPVTGTRKSNTDRIFPMTATERTAYDRAIAAKQKEQADREALKQRQEWKDAEALLHVGRVSDPEEVITKLGADRLRVIALVLEDKLMLALDELQRMQP